LAKIVCCQKKRKGEPRNGSEKQSLKKIYLRLFKTFVFNFFFSSFYSQIKISLKVCVAKIKEYKLFFTL
jgi:hypothetical protein